MRSYEKEAIVKNLLIFSSLQIFLLVVLYLQTLGKNLHYLDDTIYHDMKICSYDFKCDDFKLDFISSKNFKDKKIDKLYKYNELFALFSVPTVDNYLMKVIYPKEKFLDRVGEIKSKLLKEYFFYALLIFVFSLVLSFYTLYPIKKALELNEEFVKDIIHDINTPISSLIINLKLLKKEYPKNTKIRRVENSIKTITSLEKNLRFFLNNTSLQKEQIHLKELLHDRMKFFETIYHDIDIRLEIDDKTIATNKEAFVRIIDNLLDNACKYTTDNKVQVSFYNDRLTIQNSSQEIKEIAKIFNRYYKEQYFGTGLGLHIVQKLSYELGIRAYIKNDGEIFKVELSLKEIVS